MSLLADHQIAFFIQSGMLVKSAIVDAKLHTTDKEGNKVLSYGISSYGYDVRLSSHIEVFKTPSLWDKLTACFTNNPTHINPKHFDKKLTYTLKPTKDNRYFIPPRATVLAHTVEYIELPSNVTALVFPKSTYARSGKLVFPTVIEAGFKGEVVIEMTNQTDYPLEVFPYEGIAQFLFIDSSAVCNTDYGARNGKYQHQVGITLPK